MGVKCMKQMEELFEQFILSDEYYERRDCQPKAPMKELKHLREKFNEQDYNEIEDVVFAALSRGEKQGFINGYTYCAQQNR